MTIARTELEYLSGTTIHLDDYENSFITVPHLERYTQKNEDFRVDKVDDTEDTYIINTSFPAFYPQCDILLKLDSSFFYTPVIEDEYNLVVRLANVTTEEEDTDYIARSFDKALAWMEQAKEVEKQRQLYIKERNKYQELAMALYR